MMSESEAYAVAPPSIMPTEIDPKSAAAMTVPIVNELGFREYDARWRLDTGDGPVQLNLRGCQLIGISMAGVLSRRGVTGVIVGHDYRSYSPGVKNALVLGLIAGGINVTDVGLVPSPGAYFAQFALGVDGVAMVTASHNANGWTGIKMGWRPGITFGAHEMAELRDAVRDAPRLDSTNLGAGAYRFVPNFLDQYIDDLCTRWRTRFAGLRPMHVAVETGNGTAGAYFPEVLQRLGFQVSCGNTQLDWDFPNFNPDPENIGFLRSVGELVRSSGADVGVCMDGDGDRLGIVDERGELIFSDRVGLLVARHLEATRGVGAPFVVDVKSTALYDTELRSEVIWCKTGHSYVKQAVADAQALAGFERSGHFFLAGDLGRGYDDAANAALAFLWTAASRRATDGLAVSEVNDELPKTFQSPTRQPAIPDALKYQAVEAIASELADSRELGFAGQRIVDMLLINGIRVTLEDGSWFLIRASSNTPNLVIVAESLFDPRLLRGIDAGLREVLKNHAPDVGDFPPLYEVS